MSRRGRTIAVLSILTLIVGIVLGALPAQAANQSRRRQAGSACDERRH
ncbi:MAG: hypothetical protein MZV65_29075 [Chromatiales bacterium]|nr:hypothetical protein [Chromatiales bacterium]